MSELKGLYKKYTVINNETGEESEGITFVLKPGSDTAAWFAMATYAAHTDNDALRDDLIEVLGRSCADDIGRPVEEATQLAREMVERERAEKVIHLRSPRAAS